MKITKFLFAIVAGILFFTSSSFCLAQTNLPKPNYPCKVSSVEFSKEASTDSVQDIKFAVPFDTKSPMQLKVYLKDAVTRAVLDSKVVDVKGKSEEIITLQTKTSSQAGKQKIIYEVNHYCPGQKEISCENGADFLEFNVSPPDITPVVVASDIKNEQPKISFFSQVTDKISTANKGLMGVAVFLILGFGVIGFLTKTGRIGTKSAIILTSIAVLGLGGTFYGLFTCCTKCGTSPIGTTKCVATIGEKTVGYKFGERAEEKENIDMAEFLKLPFMTADILFEERLILAIKLLSEIFAHQAIPTEAPEVYQLAVGPLTKALQAFRDSTEYAYQNNYGIELFAFYEIQQCTRDSGLFWDKCYWKTIRSFGPFKIAPPPDLMHPNTETGEYKKLGIKAWAPRVLFGTDPAEAKKAATYLSGQLAELTPPECRAHIDSLKEDKKNLEEMDDWVKKEMKKKAK